MSKRKRQDETPKHYEVGYGKPPKPTQFKRGVSGNPKGRPKRAASFGEQFLREGRLLVNINENGRTIRISKHSVIIRQLHNKAMKAEPNALKLYVYLYKEISGHVSILEEQKQIQTRRTYKEMNIDELEALLYQQLEAGSKNDKK